MNYKDINQEIVDVESGTPVAKIEAGEIIIGVFSGLNEQGKALVNFDYNTEDNPLIAVSSINLKQKQAGRQVALLFVDGDLKKPIIIGLIHSQLDEILDNFEISVATNNDTENATTETNIIEEKQTISEDVVIDGKRLVLEGKEEIMLKCGEASITLTKAGKILIRGKYLLNRSTGVNRIMGGSVQVN